MKITLTELKKIIKNEIKNKLNESIEINDDTLLLINNNPHLKYKIFHAARFGGNLLNDPELIQLLGYKTKEEYESIFNSIKEKPKNPITQITQPILQADSGAVLIDPTFNNLPHQNDFEYFSHIENLVSNTLNKQKEIYNSFIGKRVSIHTNRELNIRAKDSGLRWWSIKDKDYVLGNAPAILLENCEFVVREGSAKKINITGNRNVHAFVEGNIKKISPWENIPSPSSGYIRVEYNPMPGIGMFQFCINKPIKKFGRFWTANSWPATGPVENTEFSGACGRSTYNAIIINAKNVICHTDNKLYAKGAIILEPLDISGRTEVPGLFYREVTGYQLPLILNPDEIISDPRKSSNTSRRFRRSSDNMEQLPLPKIYQ